ncbi:polysaccharide deacetylase family protein [Furfurilactobacillus siliginis]|uniref:Polysaccharide deacetylase n=1 Tax=Furfurilactobacillus siliginis TaxID=348151 RepID=A0A0R2LF40_9LACO|nr:polysaccharide deacetylase family protein [Furfurilactobacillus siliginis]KRN97181.1 polysaccharide deacetylase [Furfurilactobacillus siliginis]GEK28642.1 hypothetical protein LSI01_09530 [Furfurilactobacillus siliginis]
MVFCYHRILDDNQVVKVDERLSSNSQFHDFNVNVSDFKKQMNYLAAHHIKVISTAQMVQMVDQRQAIRGHYVVLTFDDIDRTTVDNAAPIMLKHHYPFTILVITGNTGEYRDGTKLATWPQILALQKRAGDKRAYAQHALPHRQRYPRLQCAT